MFHIAKNGGTADGAKQPTRRGCGIWDQLAPRIYSTGNTYTPYPVPGQGGLVLQPLFLTRITMIVLKLRNAST